VELKEDEEFRRAQKQKVEKLFPDLLMLLIR